MSLSLFRVYHLPLPLVLLSLLLPSLIASQARAEKAITEEWNISADKIVRHAKPNTIVAEGNVVLIKQQKLPPKPTAAELKASEWASLLEEKVDKDQSYAEATQPETTSVYQTTMTIKADKIVYNVDQEYIDAVGNIHIYTDDEQLFASEGTLNLASETGNFTDATVLQQDQALHLEGKKIEKTGIETYRIVDGWVITCKLKDNETPPWSFSSSEVNVRQGGYAVLKHAKFNIKNVPILYTPYMIMPVQDTRQTGFDFPEFSSSTNNGFGINLPFFLNISPSTDATFYPEYYTNRGFMPGVEFRYVAGAYDKGIFDASYLKDALSDPDETDYYDDTDYTHTNDNRYWLRGKADHTFGKWQSRLDIDIVSDEDYLNEFDTGLTGYDKSHDRYLSTFGRGFKNQSETERENSFKTLRTWSGTSLQMTLLAINDADTQASSSDTPLWKLPSIDYSGVIPLWETNFSFDWGANYVNYWREDGVGGHRFDINPSISTPLSLSPYLESSAELGIRDTFYLVETYGDEEWSNDTSQNRIYPEFEIDLATTLEKDFFWDDSGNRTASHQMRPYIEYWYIPKVDQDKLPEFDTVDRINARNRITYGIDNYLNTFSHLAGGSERLTEYAELKIEQSYYLTNDEPDTVEDATDESFSDILAELKWRPLPQTYLSYKAYYDVYDSDFNRHTFAGGYGNSRGDYLTVDYSFNENSDIEQLNATILAHIINGWSAGAEIEHSFSEKETEVARGALIYQAACWSVKFETKYTPTDTSFMVVFNLANIGVPFGVGF